MAPLKQLFVDALTLTRARVQPLPHGPSLNLVLKASHVLPLLPVTVSSIQAQMNRGIELMTAYDLGNCMKAFRACIQMVPLLAITTVEQKT
jgi:hypothetical protein